ncbi:hypothetical protein BC834DRAFT_127105 [Gloeopeniophorella convolvens]|nr:hypothetical protein BC834DRAFT_127105 [Gloeopeniophorella convolvens]
MAAGCALPLVLPLTPFSCSRLASSIALLFICQHPRLCNMIVAHTHADRYYYMSVTHSIRRPRGIMMAKLYICEPGGHGRGACMHVCPRWSRPGGFVGNSAAALCPEGDTAPALRRSRPWTSGHCSGIASDVRVRSRPSYRREARAGARVWVVCASSYNRMVGCACQGGLRNTSGSDNAAGNQSRLEGTAVTHTTHAVPGTFI